MDGEVNMKPISIGILGLGTIGSGVVRVLNSHRGELEEKIGAPLALSGIADLDITNPRKGLTLSEVSLW